jgi:cytochrome c biogenesis protein CcmG/thiol:disulfide interchange protein DsbE
VEELPALIQTAHDSGPKGLDVIGISIDAGPDASAKVKQFVTRYRVPYPMAFASAMWSGAAGVTGPPVTLLLDRQGRIAKTYIGEVESKQLAANVRTLLAET